MERTNGWVWSTTLKGQRLQWELDSEFYIFNPIEIWHFAIINFGKIPNQPTNFPFA